MKLLRCILLGILFMSLFGCDSKQDKDKKQEPFKKKSVFVKGGVQLIYSFDPEMIGYDRNIEDVVKESTKVIEQRIQESKLFEEFRLDQYGVDRISLRVPFSPEEKIRNLQELIANLGNLEFRLVAASRKQNGFDYSTAIGREINLENEWNKYQKTLQAGKKARLDYNRELFKKGYRWLPSSNAKSDEVYLVWINDGYDFDGQEFEKFYTDFVGRHVVGFELKEKSKHRFAEFMEKNKGERVAIIFNDTIRMAPTIDREAPPQGSGVISVNQKEEAAEMLSILRSGSLAVRPDLVSIRSFGPILKKQDTNAGEVILHINLAKPLNTQEVHRRLAKKFAAKVYPLFYEKNEGNEEGRQFAIVFLDPNQSKIEKQNEELKKVWHNLRLKGDQRREILESVSRKRKMLEEAQEEKRKLILENAKQESILGVENRINGIRGDIEADEKLLANLNDQIEKIEAEEKKLLEEKLACEEKFKEELRRELPELALSPFGKIEEARWSSSKFYCLSVHLYTSVSGEFLKKSLELGEQSQKIEDISSIDFDWIGLGSRQYWVWLKTDTTIENPKDEIFTTLEKEFSLGVGLELQKEQMKVEKSESPNWDFYIEVTFDQAVPEFIIQDVFKNCNLGKFDIFLTPKGNIEIREFIAFMRPSLKSYRLDMANIEKLAQKKIEKLLEGKQYKSQPVYLSHPFD